MRTEKKKSRIQKACGIDAKQEKELYKKGKNLLELYRNVCWRAWERTEDIRQTTNETLHDFGYASDDMDRALIYLETFMSENDREEFDGKIRNLFETSWFIDIIESAIVKVMDFPVYGGQYYSILEVCYIDKESYSEAEILELLDMERSSFYRKKKEAITVFGFILWGLPSYGAREIIRDRKSSPKPPKQNIL